MSGQKSSDEEKKHYTLHAGAGQFQLTMHPPATIHAGHDKVEINDFKGRSKCLRHQNGDIEMDIPDMVASARENEPHLRKIFKKALEEKGRLADIHTGIDREGEDGIIAFHEGGKFVLQAVMCPSDQNFWRNASVGKGRARFSPQEAAEAIRISIESKNKKTPPAMREKVFLVLDVRHFSLVTTNDIIEEYYKLFGSKQDGFKEIWLVGPTVKHCVCLVPLSV